MNANQSKDYAVYVGADISKSTIDLSYHSNDTHISKQVANDSKAIKKFIKTIKEHDEAHLHFIMEATGAYSRTLYTTLRDLKIRFTQVNPRFSYAFARSRGILDKTDKIDAQLLEEYGRRMTPLATIPDEDIQIELKNLYMLRVALIKARREWKQRAHHHKEGVACHIVKRMIESTEKSIKAQDKEIQKKIKKQKIIKEIFETILKIEGVGKTSASAIICLLPEIGTLSSNKICKLAGVAPMLHQSGTSVHKTAQIIGGRKHLRTALYMPCMAACISNPVIRAHFQRIRESKGGVKVKGSGAIALVACMRKLLKHINSVARKVREEMQRGVAAEGCGEAAQASPSR